METIEEQKELKNENNNQQYVSGKTLKDDNSTSRINESEDKNEKLSNNESGFIIDKKVIFTKRSQIIDGNSTPTVKSFD